MRPVFIQFVLILSVMAALASSAQCRQTVWVTDDTPGGFYITGGGDSFDPEKPGLAIDNFDIIPHSYRYL